MQQKLKSFEELVRFLSKSEQQALLANGEKSGHDGKGKSVHITLDNKGRKGKIVTIISGLQHNPQTKEKIAKILKQYCGAGGTVKEGNIEIQSDQRERVKEKLLEMNYLVK